MRTGLALPFGEGLFVGDGLDYTMTTKVPTSLTENVRMSKNSNSLTDL